MTTSVECAPENARFSKREAWGLAAQLLGLALMVGGMLTLGAFVAPAVFAHLPRPEAAALMGTLFRRYDTVLLVSLALVWLGEALQVLPVMAGRCFSCLKQPLPLLKSLLLLGLTLGLLTSALNVNPAIGRMQGAGIHRVASTPEGRDFDRLHRLSEGLYKADLLMAALLLLLAPFARSAGQKRSVAA